MFSVTLVSGFAEIFAINLEIYIHIYLTGKFFFNTYLISIS